MATKNKQNGLHDENLMDHDYDGIGELDNPPPLWIMALFYIKVRTQLHYRATGRLGSFKSGDKVLYSQKHIDKYIEDNDSEVLKKKLKQAKP
jgi:cytochrome c oxidase cbb3-type subunit 3